MTLSLVNGSAKPRLYHDRDTQQIVCRRCEEVTGTATSLFQEVIQSPMTNKGRRVGGTKALLCVHCMSRGEVTIL